MSKLLITLYIFLCPFLLLTTRKKAFYRLIVASIVALFWGAIANDMYSYNLKMFTLYGITVFPIIAWAVGLFTIYIIYSKTEAFINIDSMLKKAVLFTLLYWLFLISVETISYHLIGFHNLATASYSGLPICDCLHAPNWMKVAYLFIGPLYFLGCWLLGLEKKSETANG